VAESELYYQPLIIAVLKLEAVLLGKIVAGFF
jgi:hypothetical protein